MGVQVVIAYTIGVAAMLAAFYFTPSSLPWLQWLTVFMIGFFLYGPQMLIGLCGAELVRQVAPPFPLPLEAHFICMFASDRCEGEQVCFCLTDVMGNGKLIRFF